jgi:hypothetical protein
MGGSGIDNIITPGQKIRLFGEEHELRFTNRNYAAIQKRFNLSPPDILRGLNEFDIESVVIALWGGTLIFEPFDPADPLKIKQEISLAKLYEVNPYLLVEPLVIAMAGSQIPDVEGLAEDDGAGSEKKTGQASGSEITGRGFTILGLMFCRWKRLLFGPRHRQG